MDNIEDIRSEINNLDEKIIALLEKRFDLSKKIRAYKLENNIKVYDPKRELEILKKVDQESPEYGKYFKKIYQEIMDQSKNLQKNEEKYGLLGKKLGHSYSKKIHEKIGSYDYQYFEKEENELDLFFENKDFNGINVTIPYKKTVIKYLDYISPKAKKIGAVNTIVNKNGTLYGYNTDYDGFLYNLKENKIKIKGKKCLVLGKGASSKTVSCVLEDLKADRIVFLSRRYKPYFEDEDKYRDFEVIINTTPLGMYPNNGNYLSDIKLNNFKNLEAVIDLVYNPFMTKILIDAKLNDIKYVSGISMLISQAVKASELFLDKNFDQILIQKIKREIYKKELNIALVGMPSAGKTSIGIKLSEKMNRKFVDIDYEFVKRYGNIEKFFQEFGEEEFRKKESEIIKEISKSTGLIISCGGGVVERYINYYYLKENSIIVNVNRNIKELSIDGRPISKKYKIEEIYKKRNNFYKDFMDFEVENKDLDKTVERVERKFYEYISN